MEVCTVSGVGDDQITKSQVIETAVSYLINKTTSQVVRHRGRTAKRTSEIGVGRFEVLDPQVIVLDGIRLVLCEAIIAKRVPTIRKGNWLDRG